MAGMSDPHEHAFKQHRDRKPPRCDCGAELHHVPVIVPPPGAAEWPKVGVIVIDVTIAEEAISPLGHVVQEMQRHLVELDTIAGLSINPVVRIATDRYADRIVAAANMPEDTP